MKLPTLDNIDVSGKIVLLRADLDVPLREFKNSDGARELEVLDDTKLRSFVPTVKYLLEKGAEQILIIGHMGRYKKEGGALSTFGLWTTISKLLGQATSYWPDIENGLPKPDVEDDGRVAIIENLRKFKEEETNDLEFAKMLARSPADLYVNEAFGSSHRKHASIVGLPKLMHHVAGLHFVKEVENLSRVLKNSQKPVVVILGGAKEDKLDYLKDLEKIADKILIGGLLPKYILDSKLQIPNSKLLVANLTPDGFDIDKDSIKRFEEEIKGAGTIVVNGPMGKFEESVSKMGTKRVLKAIVDSLAFKVAGGGDTEAAISHFGFDGKFDWVSVGGGAMLEFLTKGTLPGIEALLD